MTFMQGLTVTISFALLLGAAGCAQTTQAQAINLHQPKWAADHFQQGMQAYENGNAKEAARHFKDAYTFSDAKAEAMLGVLYMNGEGVFQNAEVARAYAIAADQRDDFDAFDFYHQRWQTSQDPESAYLIAWVLANRFSGQAREDYEAWIKWAAEAGLNVAQREVALYLN